MTTSTFRLVSPAEVSMIKPGTIMFLPPKSEVPKDVKTNFDTNEGAFNHPIVVISCPDPKQMKHNSVVQIAIMTSFNGTVIKKHLAAKGIKKRTGTEAAAFLGYLRVATASKPFALNTLKLRNGKGMKRDCSYVGIRRIYAIEVRALALYGGPKEEVDTYCLTAHATKKLIKGILDNQEREKNRGEKTKLKAGTKGANGKGEMGLHAVPKKRGAGAVQKSSSRAKTTFKRVNWKGEDLN